MSALSGRRESAAEMPTTELGEAAGADLCRGCASPLARGQRYCLACGERSHSGKVPFADALAPESESSAAPAAASRGAVGPGLATAIVCLSVLFLATGVLVGRSGGSGGGQVVAAPEAITTVQQAEGGAADPAAAGKAGGSKKAKAATAGQAKAAPPPVVTGAKKAALDKAVNCRTTAECQEASKKIPNEFTTPGAPPPVDGKAPAGGAKGQVFQ